MEKKTDNTFLDFEKESEKNLTIQKAIPLFSLWQSDLSLVEFKILDIYLSLINSHEPNKRTVMLTKGELEKFLNVKKINKSQLDSWLKNLGRFVDIEEGKANKIHQIALFEEAYAELDENGQWSIMLTCTTKAMQYIFNIEKLGYLRYKLQSIISLKSRYSYILFLYLEFNRYRKSWEIDIKTLRQKLKCTEEFYDNFKYFNQRILNRSQLEIHQKTDCRFTYVPIRTGRRVTAIKFTLETIKEEIEGSEFNPIPADFKNVSDEELSRDELEVWERALIPLKLAKEQREEIFSLVITVPEEKLPPRDPEFPLDTFLQLFHYLDIKVSEILRRDSNETIKNKYAYLLKMIKQDIYE